MRAMSILLLLLPTASPARAEINALLQHLSEGRYVDAAADLEANISRYPRSSDAVGRIALVVCNGRYRIAKDPAGSRILDAALSICESAASGGSEENLRSLAKELGDEEEAHQAYNDTLTHALRREGLKLKPDYSSKRLHLAFDERPGRTF